jgi:hypothetical protein
MQRRAASLTLGDLGPTLTEVFWDNGRWSTQSQDFDDDDAAKEAWNKLKLRGYLVANEGYLWVDQSPDMVSVSSDGGAGHLFLILDEENPNTSSIGFISNAAWIVENGMGFLELTAMKYRETQEQGGNIAAIN